MILTSKRQSEQRPNYSTQRRFTSLALCKICSIRLVLALLGSIIIAACGGGGSSTGSLISEDRNEGQTTPVPTPTPTPAPTPTPTPVTLEPPQELSAPLVNASSNQSNIQAQWDDVGATHYRVLIWSEDNRTPQTITTDDTSIFVSSTYSGQVRLLVEAYDELGNSLFSDAVQLEVAP